MYSHQFNIPLLAWFDKHGRKDLPWQHPKTAYRVWVSEIMLQQTQVKTVIPYFLRFIERFPDLYSLSTAPEDDVLSLWSGLGYYQRARFLQKTASIIVEEYQGEFPSHIDVLLKLPGIGPSTAAAIASIAFNQPTPIMDGNVARVLSRYFLVDGYLTNAQVKQKLWQLATLCMSHERPADYTQAIMDLGATCCTSKNPHCNQCPLQTTCLAKNNDIVTQYPCKKPKKIRPIKSEQFLLLHNKAHEIYLEKRPSNGIWGGLWCLPSIDADKSALSHVHDTYGIVCSEAEFILSMKHIFTHFQLNITALSMCVDSALIKTATGSWVNPSLLARLGLAKPVSKIINLFYENTDA